MNIQGDGGGHGFIGHVPCMDNSDLTIGTWVPEGSETQLLATPRETIKGKGNEVRTYMYIHEHVGIDGFELLGRSKIEGNRQGGSEECNFQAYFPHQYKGI